MKEYEKVMDEKIEEILKKYREALRNDEEFSVLRQIRDELKEALRSGTSPVEDELPPERA